QLEGRSGPQVPALVEALPEGDDLVGFALVLAKPVLELGQERPGKIALGLEAASPQNTLPLLVHGTPVAGQERSVVGASHGGILPQRVSPGDLASLERLPGVQVAQATDAETLTRGRSEEHTSALQSRSDLVCRLLLQKTKK